MSKIDEMLKNEKVEWKKLGDVCEIKTGKTISKAFIAKNKGDYPVINSGKEPLGYVNTWNTEDDPIGITSRGAGVGSITYQDGKYYRGNLNYSVTIKDKTNLNFRFLYHLLLNRQSYIHNLCTYNGIPALNASELKTLELPIPSLKIQEKIAKTLDKFTNYVTELQSELQSRNRQYEYYRDKLLSEEYLNKVINNYDLYKYELKETTLGEVIKLKNGRDWKTLNKGDIPVYGSGGSMNIGVNKFSYDKETVLIPRKGSIENVFYLNEPFWNVDTIYYTEVDTNLLNVKYFYYFMKNIDLISLSINPTRPSLTQEIINNIKITLPPIEIQEKVVEILDKFQELTQNVSGLLPDEIEKREKQYEYYREKLLTFDTERTRGGYQVLSSDYISLLTQAGSLVGVKVFELRYKSLGKIGTFENGKGMPKSIFNEKGSVGAIHYGHIYTKYNLCVRNPIVKVTVQNAEKLKKVYTGDLVIAKTSENIEDVMKTVAYLGSESVVTGGHAAIFRHNENPKYLSHVFNGANYFIRQKNKLARGVKVIELSTKDMEKIKILIPPKAIQEYIVSNLDKFEALSQSTTEGLRREIELREKQYEYYREKLLTFEK